MFTPEQAEQARQQYLSEKGTEPPCPWCKVARVGRSDYIRCLRCGTNWLDEELGLTFKGKPYLEVDPRVARTANKPTPKIDAEKEKP